MAEIFLLIYMAAFVWRLLDANCLIETEERYKEKFYESSQTSKCMRRCYPWVPTAVFAIVTTMFAVARYVEIWMAIMFIDNFWFSIISVVKITWGIYYYFTLEIPSLQDPDFYWFNKKYRIIRFLFDCFYYVFAIAVIVKGYGV